MSIQDSIPFSLINEWVKADSPLSKTLLNWNTHSFGRSIIILDRMSRLSDNRSEDFGQYGRCIGHKNGVLVRRISIPGIFLYRIPGIFLRFSLF